MKKSQSIFGLVTHYRIEVIGRVDVEWLRSFDSSADILSEARQAENLTVITLSTDQAGAVGLMRRLHGLGMTILQFQVVTDGGNTA